MNSPPAPFNQYRDRVRTEWVDHNAHLNVGFYAVVFDFATDAWLDHVGLDLETKAQHGSTTFTLEAHFTYQREVREGQSLRFTTQLLDFDEKRIHYFHRMWRESDGVLASTNELMSLHVSQATRRAAPMKPDVLQRLEAVAAAHRSLERPAEAGRVMGLQVAPTT